MEDIRNIKKFRKISLSALERVDKEIIESLKKENVDTLEDFKLIGIPLLCKRTGLSKKKLQEIRLRAELKKYKVKPELADILAASGAITRASELVAFDVYEIQDLIKKVKQTEVDNKEIEDLKAKIPQLTLDEEIPEIAPLIASEMNTTELLKESVPSFRSEDLEISKSEFNTLIPELENIMKQFSNKIQAFKTSKEEKIRFTEVKALILSLQTDIYATAAKVLNKPEIMLVPIITEEEATKFADENIEPDVEIQNLSQTLGNLQNRLATLKTLRIDANEKLSKAIVADEKLSIATVDEKGVAPLRGE